MTIEIPDIFSDEFCMDSVRRLCNISPKLNIVKFQFPEYESKNDDGFEARTYKVEDIQQILDISRTAAYSLVKSEPFRVIHIGSAIRISKADFDRWLDNKNEIYQMKGAYDGSNIQEGK